LGKKVARSPESDPPSLPCEHCGGNPGAPCTSASGMHNLADVVCGGLEFFRIRGVVGLSRSGILNAVSEYKSTKFGAPTYFGGQFRQNSINIIFVEVEEFEGMCAHACRSTPPPQSTSNRRSSSECRFKHAIKLCTPAYLKHWGLLYLVPLER